MRKVFFFVGWTLGEIGTQVQNKRQGCVLDFQAKSILISDQLVR